jgi:hypothetical protein
MCGLYGFAGGDKKFPNRHKIITLGILNQSRGKDSCGIYWGHNLKHGFKLEFNKDTSIFQDLAAMSMFPVKLDNNVIIGHNRSSTFGLKTVENSHPFLYWNDLDKQEKYEKYIKENSAEYYKNGLKLRPDMILTMNGTLKDLTSYGVYTKYGEEYDFTKPHWTCDSKMLGDIMFRKGYDILNEYRGDAALAWSFPSNDKNTLYLWSGASKTYLHGNLVVERPLAYFYCKEDKGIYYSSEAIHLQTINQNGEEIINVPYNTILKFVDGQLVESIEMNRKELVNVVTPDPNYKTQTYTKQKRSYGYGNNYDSYGDYFDITDTKKSKLLITEIEEGTKRREAIVLSKGFYVYKNFNNVPTQAHGTYRLDNIGNVDFNGEFYHFAFGFLCKDEESYRELLILKKPNQGFQVVDLNKYAHPQSMWYIIDKKIGHAQNEQVWFKSASTLAISTAKVTGVRLSGCFSPMFSENNYTFEKGKFISYENKDKANQLLLLPQAEMTLPSVLACLAQSSYSFPKVKTKNELIYEIYIISGYVYNFTLSVQENLDIIYSMYESPSTVKALGAYLQVKDEFQAVNSQRVGYAMYNEYTPYDVKESIFQNLLESPLYRINLFFFEFTETMFTSISLFNTWYINNLRDNIHTYSLHMQKNLADLIDLISEPEDSDIVQEYVTWIESKLKKKDTTLKIENMLVTTIPTVKQVQEACDYFLYEDKVVVHDNLQESIASFEEYFKLSFSLNYDWNDSVVTNCTRGTNWKSNNYVLTNFNELFKTNCKSATDCQMVFQNIFNVELKLNPYIKQQIEDIHIKEFNKHFNVTTGTDFKEYGELNNITDPYEIRSIWYEESTGKAYNKFISYSANTKSLSKDFSLID